MFKLSGRVRAFAVVSAILVAPALPAVGQGVEIVPTEGIGAMFDHPLVLGVILPPMPADPAKDPLFAAVAKSAAQGADFGEEDFQFNGEIVGIDFHLKREVAAGAAAVTAARDHRVMASTCQCDTGKPRDRQTAQWRGLLSAPRRPAGRFRPIHESRNRQARENRSADRRRRKLKPLARAAQTAFSKRLPHQSR